MPFEDGAIGAYVNVVALVSNEAEFFALIEKDLKQMSLILYELNDATTVDAYKIDDRISEEMQGKIDLLSDDNRIEYYLFESYLHDDA